MENDGSSNAFGWIVLLIIVLLIGWFVWQYGGVGRNGDLDVDVDLPTPTPPTTEQPQQ